MFSQKRKKKQQKLKSTNSLQITIVHSITSVIRQSPYSIRVVVRIAKTCGLLRIIWILKKRKPLENKNDLVKPFWKLYIQRKKIITFHRYAKHAVSMAACSCNNLREEFTYNNLSCCISDMNWSELNKTTVSSRRKLKNFYYPIFYYDVIVN